MAKPQDLQRTVTRRAMLVGSVMGMAGMALMGRLSYLQFFRGEEYRTLAEGNRIKLQLLTPPRGIISDREGVEMATNNVSYRVFLDRENPPQARETIKRLGVLLRWSAVQTNKILAQIPNLPRGPLLVAEHINWDQLVRIEYFQPELPAILLEEGQVRTYPFSDHAAHLIGYVGRVAEGEASAGTPLARLPEFKIGKNGVEHLFDARLQGTAGTKQIEVNVTGLPVRELNRVAPIPGEHIHLTVDSRLQEYIVQRLEGQSGAVVVMHVHTGELIALTSVPGFDPNIFSKAIPQPYWDALMADEKAPLTNKAIAGQYPPGSTFKMLIGLAALESGKVDLKTSVFCPGHFFLGNHRFNCWKPEGHGHMTLKTALAESCDTYFYTVGRAAGIEAMSEVGHKLGIGELTGLGLRGEKQGIMPDPAWKRRVRGAPWNPGETINTAIGQGDVLTTPLQLAVMTARMVNGGKAVIPRLTRAEGVVEFPPLGFNEAHLKAVVDGMDMVINSPRGTAYGSRLLPNADLTAEDIAAGGYGFAGKTGTAQVRRITIRGQDQSKIPWKFRHHALFVAYGPTTNPTYAASVLIEHGGGGASAAAPVARDVMAKLFALGLAG
jgi:penicillin-binding protein 2